MAHGNMTPRQKMINLLYLVLMAILALNVSSEVLDAFKSVNDGISVSNTSLRTKNADIYYNLSAEFKNDSLKARMAYDQSQKAHEISARLYKLLEQYKGKMISEAGRIDDKTGKIKRDDNLDIPTHLFVENDGKEGKLLKNQIVTTRNELLNLLDPQERAAVENSFTLKIDTPVSGKQWEYARFNQVPVVAAVTLLTKYQNDLLSAESHVIETLYTSINSNQKKVDRMEARIISPSSYILQGEAYKADVLVAAYSSTQHPDVFLGTFNSNIKKEANGEYSMLTSASDAPPLINPEKVDVEGGFGKIQMAGNGSGNKKYTGVVRVKGPHGENEFYPFEGEYQVAPKVAVVSPKMMNVLYVGLDNPVDISVPGVAQSDITATLDGIGTLIKNADGTYMARVTKAGTAKVRVSARIGDKQVAMGEEQFRVKNIPNPLTTLDGIATQSSNTTAFFVKQRKGVVAKSDDFVYGPIQWQVLRYVVSVRTNSIDLFKFNVEGPLFNEKVKNMIKTMKKGDALFVDDIIVRGPDGTERKISPIAYNLIQN